MPMPLFFFSPSRDSGQALRAYKGEGERGTKRVRFPASRVTYLTPKSKRPDALGTSGPH